MCIVGDFAWLTWEETGIFYYSSSLVNNWMTFSTLSGHSIQYIHAYSIKHGKVSFHEVTKFFLKTWQCQNRFFQGFVDAEKKVVQIHTMFSQNICRLEN